MRDTEFFAWSDSDSTGGNGCELGEGGLGLDVREKLCTV